MDEKLIRLISQFALLGVIGYVLYAVFGNSITQWEAKVASSRKQPATPTSNQVDYVWPKL